MSGILSAPARLTTHDVQDARVPRVQGCTGAADRRLTDAPIDAVDRRIILATQAGLPLVPRPYHVLAEQLGLAPADLVHRLQRMLQTGVIRRIGAVPNHYALGYRANAMTVWDVADEEVQRLGRRIGELAFVSHCYRRPRYRPAWPYNLFAMVHGRSRAEVEEKVVEIARLLGASNHGQAALYSTRILKKTGLRITPRDR